MSLPDLPTWPTLGTRLLIIACALAAWFATQRLIGRRSAPAESMEDALHRLTAPANAWLHRQPRAADALLVASSLWIDVITLFVFARALFGPDFAPFWGLFGLFAARQACQVLVALPVPPGIIWRPPGFPSLFVTYEVSHDFFFSGHTALAVYGALQVSALGLPWLGGIAIVMAAAEIAVVIALRAHWTLDVIAGAAAAIVAGYASGAL